MIKYLNRNIELETGRGTVYKGKIVDLDDWGVHFLPQDEKLKPAIISWDDIRKVILIEESKVPPVKKKTSIFEAGKP